MEDSAGEGRSGGEGGLKIAWGVKHTPGRNTVPRLSLSDTAGSTSLAEWWRRENPPTVDFFYWIDEQYEDDLVETVGWKIDGASAQVKEKDLAPKLHKYLQKLCPKRFKLFHNTQEEPFLRAEPDAPPTSKPDGLVFPENAPEEATHIVAVFDYKRGNGHFAPKDRAQVATYCHRVLAVHQPDRKYVFGFLLNAKFVQFFRVERSTTGFVYACTAEAPVVTEETDGESSAGDTASDVDSDDDDDDDTAVTAPDPDDPASDTNSDGTGISTNTETDDLPLGLVWLSSFFAADSKSLGFQVVNNPFGRHYPHDTLLGHGVSARVFSVRGRPEMVIKLYRNAEAGHEAKMLTRLKKWKVPHVPELVQLDNKRNVGLLLRPRAKDLADGQFSREHAVQVVDVLEKVHTKGYVHRDIRPANLLVQQDGNILVNDWGFAVRAGASHSYCGTLIHASDAVLGHIADGKATFPVSAADDLVSLVRATYVLTQAGAFVSIPGIDKASYPGELAKRLIEGWNRHLPPLWQRMHDLAKECQYAKLRETFRDTLRAGPDN